MVWKQLATLGLATILVVGVIGCGSDKKASGASEVEARASPDAECQTSWNEAADNETKGKLAVVSGATQYQSGTASALVQRWPEDPYEIDVLGTSDEVTVTSSDCVVIPASEIPLMYVLTGGQWVETADDPWAAVPRLAEEAMTSPNVSVEPDGTVTPQ